MRMVTMDTGIPSLLSLVTGPLHEPSLFAPHRPYPQRSGLTGGLDTPQSH